MTRRIQNWTLPTCGLFVWSLCSGCNQDAGTSAPQVLIVRPGESIQAALDQAADSGATLVRVEEGTYRPDHVGQALIWFNARHDGITLEAEGDVILTAANPDLADPKSESFPAIVNHVVYFGDGVSNSTIIRGFRITGANGFETQSEGPEIQPDTGLERLKKEQFFYSDGGGIKVFGRSFPVIENLVIEENFALPCGEGVSIEHRGFNSQPVLIRNCIFRNNRARLTGSALDVLPGSAAAVENCLFVGNLGNLGTDNVSPAGENYNSEHGSGAMTVFYESRVTVTNCTFTDNWNGVDDKGRDNVYRRCIFWRNQRNEGLSPGGRYEIDILDGRGVLDCMLNGEIVDLRHTLSDDTNTLEAPDPEFDAQYIPQASRYEGIGYRPAGLANHDDVADTH